MTANAMQGDRQMCLDAGMDDYISKPIHVDEIVRALGASRPLSDSETAKLPMADALAVGEQALPASVVAGAGSGATLDPAALRTLEANLGGDFANVALLIDSFLEEAPHLAAELEASVQSGAAVAVRRVAHSLKSNGSDFGATRFAGLCKEMEMMGSKRQDLTGL